jgi:hypothetical protein
MVSMDAIDLGNARKAAGTVGQARLGAYASSEAAKPGERRGERLFGWKFAWNRR